MAIPEFAVKIVMVGNLPGGEEWSTSLWIAVTHLLGVTDLTNTLQQFDTDAAAGGGLYHGITLVNPAQVTLKTLYGYQYLDGSHAGVQAVYTSTFVPSASAPTLPNQVAVVCSLRSAQPGRSFRGRMYLPALNTAIGINGQATSVNLDTLCAGAATTFGTFNASGFGKVSIMSSVKSAMTPVTAVEVDHVLDTQRRRRNKLVDTAPSVHAVAA